VYYTKTSDDPADYLVDHSIIMYLVDPEGKFVTFFGKNVAEPELGCVPLAQRERKPPAGQAVELGRVPRHPWLCQKGCVTGGYW